MIKKLFFIFFIFFIAGSCKKKTGNPVLSDEETVRLFIDIHLADAALNVKNISAGEHKNSSSFYYNYIFNKYGITRNDFNNCLNYYTYHPEAYKAIYEQVADSIGRLKKEINKTWDDKKRTVAKKNNIWKGNPGYTLNGEGKQKIPFKVKLRGRGYYTISTLIRIFEEDYSENPQMIVFFTNGNDKGEETVKSVLIQKDGKFNNYEIKLGLTDLNYGYLEGFFFTYDNENEHFQHIEIKNIKIVYSPDF